MMRVTDAETMQVVEMVPAGQVNKEVGDISISMAGVRSVSPQDGTPRLLAKKLLQEVVMTVACRDADIGGVGDGSRSTRI
jgi:acetylglutamate kinase